MPSVRDILIWREGIVGHRSRVFETVASQALCTLDLSFFALPAMRFSGDENPGAGMPSIEPLVAMLTATAANERTRNTDLGRLDAHNLRKPALRRRARCVGRRRGDSLLSNGLVVALVEAWVLTRRGGGCKSNKQWGEALSNQL
jgi:hypothetical protein